MTRLTRERRLASDTALTFSEREAAADRPARSLRTQNLRHLNGGLSFCPEATAFRSGLVILFK